jgi:hypothetical protein
LPCSGFSLAKTNEFFIGGGGDQVAHPVRANSIEVEFTATWWWDWTGCAESRARV